MRVHRLQDVLGPSKCMGGLIVLNGPSLDVSVLENVWPVNDEFLSTDSSHFIPCPTICADGGANLLRVAKSDRVPTAIVGDLDSVSTSVLSFYSARSTRVVKDEDQDHNDFEKSIREMRKLQSDNDREKPIIVIGGRGGSGQRLDQALGNFNCLYREAERGHCMWWIDKHNATIVLPPGENRIVIDSEREGPTAGLIPIGGPVTSVTTTGLKWNLNDQKLAFGVGGLISTSNHIFESSVYVNTSHPLLWTVELKSIQFSSTSS